MIEVVPPKIKNAILYFHSAGTNSNEFKPFLKFLTKKMPNTYFWIGDGNISGSPIMFKDTYYGSDSKKYWFMFPMQDASSKESFQENKEAMGASLISAGSFVNKFIDQIKEKYSLSADKITLCGFQHGSSLALSAAMMRKIDPLKSIILFEPYLLEAFYLNSKNIVTDTKVICIENEYIRNRTYAFIGIYTDHEFSKIGMDVKQITIEEGNDKLCLEMVEKAFNELNYS